MQESRPKRHEVAFGLAGVLLGFIIKLIIDWGFLNLIPLDWVYILNNIVFKELVYIVVFVIIATYIIKRATIPLTMAIFPILVLLHLRTGKINRDEGLTERHINILAPGVIMSLLMPNISNFSESLAPIIPLSVTPSYIIVLFLMLVMFFMISLKLAEHISLF